MSMSRTSLLLALLTLTAAGTLAIPSADAAGRARSRAVTANPAGGATGTVNASGSHWRGGNHQRGRTWQGDGQGNASGSSGASANGANGGHAERQGSFYRNADGSAGRTGSASATGANGGHASTSGGITRNADGTVSGVRDTTATGRNGNGYQGSTTYSDGTLTHTGTCTNAAGETIACRGN